MRRKLTKPRSLYARIVSPAVAALALATLLQSAAIAQTPPPGQPGAPPEMMDPPAESQSPPTDPSTEGGEPQEPLSEELKRKEGVLEPPRGIDPKIQQPVPDDFDSKTPVIPPPQEPGSQDDNLNPN